MLKAFSFILVGSLSVSGIATLTNIIAYWVYLEFVQGFPVLGAEIIASICLISLYGAVAYAINKLADTKVDKSILLNDEHFINTVFWKSFGFLAVLFLIVTYFILLDYLIEFIFPSINVPPILSIISIISFGVWGHTAITRVWRAWDSRSS